MARPTTHTAVHRWAAVPPLPRRWRGPRCARPGCAVPAWFTIHHVQVCSSRCAERLATEPQPQPQPQAFPPVVRAVRWTYDGAAWTLVIASCGRRHQHWRAWWWPRDGTQVGAMLRARSRSVDVRTDDGLFAFLRRLVRAGAIELSPYRLVRSDPPWADLAGVEEPVALAKRTARRTRAAIRRVEEIAARRARYRQRGQIQDGTADHAARVA